MAAAALAAVLPFAWIGDDAMITLHQVRVFVAGDGIVWNPGVRVQAFTHPLWFGLLSAAHWFTGALFWPALVLSVALSVAAILVLWRTVAAQPAFAGRGALSVAFVLVLLLSPGVRDYATSGLETPLSFLLAALILRTALAREGPASAGLWLLLACAVLARPDHAVLFGPLAAVLGWQALRERRLAPVLPGAALLAGWAAFATLYFGAPLPNTALAKAATGLPPTERIDQGLVYFADALAFEGVTLPLVLLGAAAGLTRPGAARLLALGLFAYLAYLLWIGGDFMRGRLLAVPAMTGLALLAAAIPPRARRLAGLALAGIAAVTTSLALARMEEARTWRPSGIMDEQAFYAPVYGALSPTRAWPEPAKGSFAKARATEAVIACAVGALRFSTPPDTHIIDYCALTDPFLARLPAARDPAWRIGHHARAIPANYPNAVLDPSVPLSVPEAQALFDTVRTVTTAPLLAPERLRALALLLTSPPPVNGPAWIEGGRGLAHPTDPPPADWTVLSWPALSPRRALMTRSPDAAD